jgi:hypothetical protein
MLTAEKPFSGPDRPVEAPRPSLLVPDVPEALDAVFQKAVAGEVEERFQTAAELGDALFPFCQ